MLSMLLVISSASFPFVSRAIAERHGLSHAQAAIEKPPKKKFKITAHLALYKRI